MGYNYVYFVYILLYCGLNISLVMLKFNEGKKIFFFEDYRYRIGEDWCKNLVYLIYMKKCFFFCIEYILYFDCEGWGYCVIYWCNLK